MVWDQVSEMVLELGLSSAIYALPSMEKEPWSVEVYSLGGFKLKVWIMSYCRPIVTFSSPVVML